MTLLLFYKGVASLAQSGISRITLEGSAAETIVDRNTFVFDSAVFDASVFDTGLTVRLRPSGAQRVVGGTTVTGGAAQPGFEFLAPVRRRGTVRVRLRARAAEILVASGRGSLEIAAGGPGSLQDAGTALSGLVVQGTDQIAAGGRAAVRFYVARGWAVAEDGEGSVGFTGTGRQRVAWSYEAEDELILLGV